MKRFTITNVQNGLQFQIEREELGPLQPEWGTEPQIVEQDLTAVIELVAKQDEARSYLASTDWYIIRELDTGVPCPPEIKAARQAAREKL